MTTEEDRTAGSNYLTCRLIDLARAAHWAQLMKDEQDGLNEVMSRFLTMFKGPNDDKNVTVDQAVAELREEAVHEYMNGVSEDADDPAEASFAQERINEVVEKLELIATRAEFLNSYAQYARHMIDPPKWVQDDPWVREEVRWVECREQSGDVEWIGVES